MPTDRNGQFWVHFNRHDPARYVSATDVVHERVDPDRFRGRLVLIGTSAIGLLDTKTTPVEPAMPGVEVHAQILESVLTKALLTRPNYAIGAELLLAVVLGLAIIIAAPMLPASIVVALGVLLIGGLVALSWYFFVVDSLLIDFTYPLISCWLIYLVLTFSTISASRSNASRSGPPSASIFRRSSSSSSRSRRRSSCSAARSGA